MASEENHNVFPEDDLDEDDDDSEEEEDQDPLTLPHQQQQQLDDEDDDVLGEENDDVLEEDEDFNSASSADPTTVTVAVPPPVIPKIESGPDPKRHRVEEESPIAVVVVQEEKKVQQLQQPLDESRRLFQRLWTDEDEIELLQGFLEYTTQRGSSQHHHHDTALFYDQIKSKLQLDFNKNQLVEKLRRLKKKYRNVVSRISSGKEFVFKSPHDQATFEISRKIWCDSGRAGTGGGVAVAEDGGLDDEEPPNANQNPPFNLNFTNNSMNNHNDGIDANSAEKKGQRSRKRSRVKIEEKRVLDDKVTAAAAVSTPASSIPGLIEDTVRSCLSPLFKELLNNAMNGPSNGAGGRGFGGGMLSPLPLNFGGGSSALGNFLGGEMVDEKWRKQQILELEVYSKRLDLVQDQIKATLEDLRSTRS